MLRGSPPRPPDTRPGAQGHACRCAATGEQAMGTGRAGAPGAATTDAARQEPALALCCWGPSWARKDEDQRGPVPVQHHCALAGQPHGPPAAPMQWTMLVGRRAPVPCPRPQPTRCPCALPSPQLHTPIDRDRLRGWLWRGTGSWRWRSRLAWVPQKTHSPRSPGIIGARAKVPMAPQAPLIE